MLVVDDAAFAIALMCRHIFAEIPPLADPSWTQWMLTMFAGEQVW